MINSVFIDGIIYHYLRIRTGMKKVSTLKVTALLL